MIYYRSRQKKLYRTDPHYGEQDFLYHFDVFAIRYISALFSEDVLFVSRFQDERYGILTIFQKSEVFDQKEEEKLVSMPFGLFSLIQDYWLLELSISLAQRYFPLSQRTIISPSSIRKQTATYGRGSLLLYFSDRNRTGEAIPSNGNLLRWMTEFSMLIIGCFDLLTKDVCIKIFDGTSNIQFHQGVMKLLGRPEILYITLFGSKRLSEFPLLFLVKFVVFWRIFSYVTVS